jgi:hypothetical protein
MNEFTEPPLLEPVFQALRQSLPQLRRSNQAAAQIAAALEICASEGDEEASRLRAEILREDAAIAA